MKTYTLFGAGGFTQSQTPGTLGGNRSQKIYGRLDCPTALRYVAQGTYQKSRVFFADEAAAIAAGFRPCASCLKARYVVWKAGGEPGGADYPWTRLPKPAASTRTPT